MRKTAQDNRGCGKIILPPNSLYNFVASFKHLPGKHYKERILDKILASPISVEVKGEFILYFIKCICMYEREREKCRNLARKLKTPSLSHCK